MVKGTKSKTELMREIRDEVMNLTSSPLYEDRVQNGYYPVLGEGSHDASIMFVGEGPGLNEAKTGRPFCGASGKILDKLLDEISIPRSEVYITNIIKDRPPKNRDPSPEEIEIYAPYLDRQIEIIKPKVIATLGRYSMVYVMKKFGLESQVEPISAAHGKEYEVNALFGSFLILPLYHPAVAVYNNKMFDTLKKDFEKLALHHEPASSKVKE